MSKAANKNILHKFLLREVSFIGRQRLTTLVFYDLILVMGFVFNITGITGIENQLFIGANTLFLLAVGVLFVLYIFGRMQLKVCLYATTISTHIFLTAETVMIDCENSALNNQIALASIILLALNCLYSTLSYLKWNPLLLGGITVAVCALYMCRMNDGAMRDFMVLITVSLIVMSICGERLVANSALLSSENAKYRQDEQELLLLFRMNRTQMRAYIHLGINTYATAVVEKLFAELDPETARNIMTNVMLHANEKKSTVKKIKKALPCLTPSEREICTLIIQGKKQGEICRLLNKSKSNVNSQRVHIRKKLSLLPQDNLRDALKNRIGQERE